MNKGRWGGPSMLTPARRRLYARIGPSEIGLRSIELCRKDAFNTGLGKIEAWRVIFRTSVMRYRGTRKAWPQSGGVSLALMIGFAVFRLGQIGGD
jgi:hypothetical protein